MRREEPPVEGWYYKQDGQAFGPIPTGHLKELLAAGRIQPRQAVWQRGNDGLRFVHAATAASRTTASWGQPSPSEPAPACGEDPETVRRELAQLRQAIVTMLRERFERAAHHGDLPAGTDCATLARYIATGA